MTATRPKPSDGLTYEKLIRTIREFQQGQDRLESDVRSITGLDVLNQSFAMDIIWPESVVDTSITLEDWSQVRSPSRAARRRAQGHRQNIRTYHPPLRGGYRINGQIYMHPAMRKDLQKALEECAPSFSAEHV